MVKLYQRYEASGTPCGLCYSATGNVVLACDGQTAYSPALEYVVVWNLRQGSVIRTLGGGERAEPVTALARSPDGETVAAGHADGTVVIWRVADGAELVVLNGHRSAVHHLTYNDDGARLASSSKDTDIIVWDVIAQAGLCRLKGHKGVVTQAEFLSFEGHDLLVSASKDTLVKFWDLDTEHCIYTVVGHRSEVTSFVVVGNKRLITGTTERDLRVWDLLPADEEKGEMILSVEAAGSVQRQSKERVVTMKMCGSSIVVCHGAEKMVEFLRLRTEKEIKAKLARRQRRLKEKGKDKDKEVAGVGRTMADEIASVHTVRMIEGVVRSCDVVTAPKNDSECTLLVGCSNNILQSFNVVTGAKESDSQKSRIASLASHGHHNDIRSVAISDDDSLIASTSKNSLKIWNSITRKCIRTMETGYGVACVFLPGNKHVLVGTKKGTLELYDISAAVQRDCEQVHEGAIWSIALTPDARGFATVSADGHVKLFEFELVSNEQGSKRLGFAHTKTMKMSDGVLCCCFSPNGKFLAVSLLDNTVKVFHVDTLKFFLSLYGHKLPVMSISISSDSAIIATASADKNVKIWGLDFGDCHKSYFAHTDSVMGVRFVPDTHYFFTVGKDKLLKLWDADEREQITTHEGHHSEVWCMAVSSRGDFVVTGSHDRSLRLWERTEDQTYVDEIREEERTRRNLEVLKNNNQQQGDAAMPGKTTLETISSGEMLIEAVEVTDEEYARRDALKTQKGRVGERGVSTIPNPVFEANGFTEPRLYVLHALKKVRPSAMEEALLFVPFMFVVRLLRYLDQFLVSRLEPELCTKVVLFLLRSHHNQIILSKNLLPVVDSLRKHTRAAIQELRDTIGFNIAGLTFLKRRLEGGDVRFFEDAPGKVNEIKETKRLRIFK